MDRIQRRDFRRGELVQHCVNVPTIESRDTSRLVLRRDGGLVKGRVGGMLKRGDLEALVIVYSAVADELDLRYAQNRLEVWMQDGFNRGLSL
jgi:hypothetical protein